MGDAPQQVLSVESRVEAIDAARTWVTERVRAAGANEDTVGEIELALTEALANVIEHGYQGDETQKIEVGFEVEAARLRVSVRDWGRQADPAAFESRDLDDPGEGGYGVFLMEQLMDDVSREPQPDGGTLLILTKQREDESHD
jgi:serine/threonine-protein kinase RsbW